MKKNRKDLIEKHLYLEKWLDDNYPNNLTDIELINYFSQNFKNKHDVRYLLSAYFLPKGDFINVPNSEICTLCLKYSITEERALERINEVSMMCNINKQKLLKPKLIVTSDSISDIIDSYIDRNKSLLDRKVILEMWLKENYISSSEEMINYIYNLFNEDDANYLTNAYFMPIDKIISKLTKYDINNSIIFESVIQNLMIEYETDRETILSRIEDAIAINYMINKEDKLKSSNKNKKRMKKG